MKSSYLLESLEDLQAKLAAQEQEATQLRFQYRQAVQAMERTRSLVALLQEEITTRGEKAQITLAELTEVRPVTITDRVIEILRERPGLTSVEVAARMPAGERKTILTRIGQLVGKRLLREGNQLYVLDLPRGEGEDVVTGSEKSDG